MTYGDSYKGVATTNRRPGGCVIGRPYRSSQRVDRDLTAHHQLRRTLEHRTSSFTMVDGTWSTQYWPLFWAQVTFLVTEDPSRVQGRARREVLSPMRFEPYEAVALASGGEVIFTKDQHIQDVAAIVGDSMADLVSKYEGQRD